MIDRDKVVVPPNWDSWGKIRVLRDGFDVEATSNGWSLDIDETADQPQTNGHAETADNNESHPNERAGAVQAYEEIVRDPSLDALQATSSDSKGTKLEVSSVDPQAFLATQLEVLEKLRANADSSNGIDSSRIAGGRASVQASIENGDKDEEGRVNEHIGPVQFNMGGIQVDADDMMKRLKVSSPSAMVYWKVEMKELTNHCNRIDKDSRLLSHSHLVCQVREMAMVDHNRKTSNWPRSLLG